MIRRTRPLLLSLVAAGLFGVSTPISKALLSTLSPFQLAGLLYLGAAIGVLPAAMRGGGIRLPLRADARNRLRLLGAVVAGGILGPVLLLGALRIASAASVSLWLNLEMVATALLGALFFHDHLGSRGVLGVVLGLAAAVLLSLPEGAAGLFAVVLVVLACVCWGLDNQLTSQIDGLSAAQSTFWKGLVAGSTNVAIGWMLSPQVPSAGSMWGALIVGAFAYGVSIALYIAAAQQWGATRAQIAFSTAPLFGVASSVLLLRERLEPIHFVSAALFAAAIVLLWRERHEHAHVHAPLDHEHGHRHDDGHHVHRHPGLALSVWHSHLHRHEPLAHAHPHWPDLHHRHEHGEET